MAEPERPARPPAHGDLPGQAGKRVDEDWKERVEQEQARPAPEPAPGESRIETPAAARPEGVPIDADPSQGGVEGPAAEGSEAGPVEARFDVFISGLSMEALIALGDLPHPTAKKRGVNLPQAKYLIDLLGVLEEKTRGNLTAEESQLLQDVLYQLRMRYLGKTEKA